MSPGDQAKAGGKATQPFGFHQLRQACEISTLRQEVTRILSGAAELQLLIENEVEQVRQQVGTLSPSALEDAATLSPLLSEALAALIEIREASRRLEATIARRDPPPRPPRSPAPVPGAASALTQTHAASALTQTHAASAQTQTDVALTPLGAASALAPPAIAFERPAPVPPLPPMVLSSMVPAYTADDAAPAADTVPRPLPRDRGILAATEAPSHAPPLPRPAPRSAPRPALLAPDLSPPPPEPGPPPPPRASGRAASVSQARTTNWLLPARR
jgi:hypothetical protein